MRKDKVKGRKKRILVGLFCVRCLRQKRHRRRRCAPEFVHRFTAKGPATAFPFLSWSQSTALRLQAIGGIVQSFAFFHSSLSLFLFLLASPPNHHPPTTIRSVCVLRQHHQGFPFSPSALCRHGHFFAPVPIRDRSLFYLIHPPKSPLFLYTRKPIKKITDRNHDRPYHGC